MSGDPRGEVYVSKGSSTFDYPLRYPSLQERIDRALELVDEFEGLGLTLIEARRLRAALRGSGVPGDPQEDATDG